jgi:putative tricarboxylic transport membrane protein
MEQKQTQSQPHPVWLTYDGAEVITAVTLFLIGVVMMIDGYRVGMGWAFDGPMAGYFPFRTGAIICVSSLVIFFRTLFTTHHNFTIFVSWDRFKLVLYVLLPTVLYVLATQFVGIYVASAVFIGGFMRAMGNFSWLKIILISICISTALFWMFEIQFMVPLPKGPLESWLGH